VLEGLHSSGELNKLNEAYVRGEIEAEVIDRYAESLLGPTDNVLDAYHNKILEEYRDEEEEQP
jgi:hypothetical protein